MKIPFTGLRFDWSRTTVRLSFTNLQIRYQEFHMKAQDHILLPWIVYKYTHMLNIHSPQQDVFIIAILVPHFLFLFQNGSDLL